MIDHLIRFNSEAAAIAALPQFYNTWTEEVINEETQEVFPVEKSSWDTSRCLPNVKVWRPQDDIVSTDEGGNELRTHVYLPYWYIIISLPERDQSLSCMLITDREKAIAGEPFILHSLIPAENLNDYEMAPLFAGCRYPFGTVV